jgi:hypothetical protein
MVQRRAGGDELAHHAVVAQVRGGDQRGAVVAAGGELGAGAQRPAARAAWLVVGHGGDGHGVVAVVAPAGRRSAPAAASARTASRWRANVATCRAVRPWLVACVHAACRRPARAGCAARSPLCAAACRPRRRHLGRRAAHLRAAAGGQGPQAGQAASSATPSQWRRWGSLQQVLDLVERGRWRIARPGGRRARRRRPRRRSPRCPPSPARRRPAAGSRGCGPGWPRPGSSARLPSSPACCSWPMPR